MNRYVMWLTLLFVCGVAVMCPLADRLISVALVAFAIGFCIVCLVRKRPLFLLFAMGSFALGMLVMNINTGCNDTFADYADGRHTVVGEVVDSYYSGGYTVSVVRTEKVDYKPLVGTVRLYVESESPFDYGDMVYFVGSVSVPHEPQRSTDVDYRAYNFSRGIYANCFAKPSAVKVISKGDGGFSLERFGSNARRKIKASVKSLYPDEQSGILTALMLGDKSGVSDEFKDVGSKVGIYHTMATSGLHVIILLTFFALFVGRLRNRKAMAAVNIVILVLIYVVIGFSPSISRAVIMAMMSCIASATFRKADSYTSLALSALVILIFRPYALFDVGFLLSFASTLGIMVIYKKISASNAGKIRSVLMTSVAALLGTGALTAHYFQRVSLLGIFANVLIVPLAEIILPLGYVSVILFMVYQPLGQMLSYVVYPLVNSYVYIAEWFAKVPFASAQVPGLAPLVTFIITVGILILFAWIPTKDGRNDSRTIEEEFAEW